MKKIVILGSTGSIGISLINIIKKDKRKFKIELLTANKNYKKLIKQIKFFNVKNVIITDKKSFIITKEILKNKNINIYNDFNSLSKISLGFFRYSSHCSLSVLKGSSFFFTY